MKHWHVQRHNEDDDIFATWDRAEAFAYAADELNRMADHEREGISACGEGGGFEEAYRCFERAERYAGLAANAANIHKQLTAPVVQRAPLYAGQDEGYSLVLLGVAVARQLAALNGPESPAGFRVWECTETD